MLFDANAVLLRAQAERGDEREKKRKWRDRAEKLNMGCVHLARREETLEATVATLRAALERAVSAISALRLCSHPVPSSCEEMAAVWSVREQGQALLATPDPSAPYRAVVEALRGLLADVVAREDGTGRVHASAATKNAAVSALAALPTPRPVEEV